MTKIYARNLITKISNNVVAHHYVQTAKGKLQRVVKCVCADSGIIVTTARRGESSVSATDVYYDTDVFKLNDLMEYYADKQDIYKVMYPELDTNIAWNLALGDKEMSKDTRVFGKVEGCENLKGYTLYELFTLCRSIQEDQESLEDCVGDLAVLPQVILDLVLCVEQLTAELDQRTKSLNHWQECYTLLAKGKS